MLTAAQPVQYGYKSVHDLPTPPSTSRPSPPLAYQEPPRKRLPSVRRSHSPPDVHMSAPHRGLPPPAAMALPHQQPPPHPAGAPPPPPTGPHGPPVTGQVPPPSGHALRELPGRELPVPPAQWQGAEESMRSWLAAKTEEERRKQEEERTKQESLRLEQRRIEADMLRTSLQGGIPPPIVPLVFAGMGGTVPTAALDAAQQYISSHASQAQGGQHPLLMAPQGQRSPDHRRDSQSQGYAPYPGAAPSTPSSAAVHGYGAPYPGSPTTRGRAQTLSSTGSTARPLVSGSNLPNLNTSVPPPGLQSQPGSSSLQGHTTHPVGQTQSAPAQQETQQSPGIHFHHWQPPTSQAGSSTQPATPSVGESPRNKRKATGAQQPAPVPTQHRFRSPPVFHSGSTIGQPPPGRRRGHSRQRSDIAPYRSGARSRGNSLGPPVPMPPLTVSTSGPGEGDVVHFSSGRQQQQQPSARGIGGHSVSSLLSDEPSTSQQYPGHDHARLGGGRSA